MVSADFIRQIEGYGLTTADITYRMPDYLTLLQTFIWQTYDVAPLFPGLHSFLEFWGRELDGPLHSVTVAHRHLIGADECRVITEEYRLH